MPDLEYLSRIISLSNYGTIEMTEKMGSIMLEEMKNRLDYVAQRGIYANFVNIVRNLTEINVYDLELMDNIFRPDFIRCIHKKSKKLDMPLYEIDGFNRINLRDIYHGNRLEESHLERTCFFISWIPDRVNRYRKNDLFAYAVEDAVRKYFPHCQYAHAVPYRRHAG